MLERGHPQSPEMSDVTSPPKRTALPAADRASLLRSGPVLSTLLRLTLPNLVALGSSTVVSIAETVYVGAIGVAALGGVALAFPVFMLMQLLSAGAMGGTISGVLSRALGAQDRDRAQALALCSIVIAIVFGLALSVGVWILGPVIFSALGGKDAVLAQALAYSNTAAWAIPGIWLANTLASILRGSGNMTIPAATLLVAGLGQVAVGGALGLGVGPFPRLGLAGVAAGQLVTFWAAAAFLFAYLRSDCAAVGLRFHANHLRAEHFAAILRIGGVAMLSPVFSVASVLVLTRLVANFGPQALAGYGIGVRLEFLLIPIAFSVGVASVPMVGMAIGSGDVLRARAIAWTSGIIAFGVIGSIGLIAALFPGLWTDLFTAAPEVRNVAYDYFGHAGYAFGFFGVGLCLYFASQGAGRIGGVILAQALRLLIIVAGGWSIISSQGQLSDVFLLSASAMAAMGIATAFVVKLSRWGSDHL